MSFRVPSSTEFKRRRMDRKKGGLTPKTMPRHHNRSPAAASATSAKKSNSKDTVFNNNENDLGSSPRLAKRVPKIEIVDTTTPSPRNPARRNTLSELYGNVLTPSQKRQRSVSGSSSPADAADLRRVQKDVSQSESQSIKVTLRIRPCLGRDCNADGGVMQATGGQLAVVQHGKNFEFNFETILDDSACDTEDRDALERAQDRMYATVGQPQLCAFTQGYNCTIFAYGQTGSGKTFSMFGAECLIGLIPRFCTNLFEWMAATPEMQSSVELAFYEIYNEQIFDLLSEGARVALPLKRDPNNGRFVKGLTWVPTDTARDIQTIIRIGQGRRATAATGMNGHSSRSHSIVQLTLTQTRVHSVDGRENTSTTVSQANLVDLAGSERSDTAQQTVSSREESKQRYNETLSINTSLSALNMVIKVMSDACKSDKPAPHVPYRNSVLTHLLSESLGGNSKTALLATVSPLADQLEESLSTCRFASMARAVITNATVNQDQTSALVKRIIELEAQLEQNESSGQSAEQVATNEEVVGLKDELRCIQEQYNRIHEENRRNKELAQATKARLLSESGGTFSVDELRKGDGPLLVTLHEDVPHTVTRVVPPHTLKQGQQVGTLCRLDFVDEQWVVKCGRRDSELYVNGAHIDTGTAPLHHLDRVVLDGDQFLLFWNPDSTSASALCDPTVQLLKYDFCFARQEYLMGYLPRFGQKMEEKRVAEVEQCRQQLCTELDAMKKERAQLDLELEGARRELHRTKLVTKEDDSFQKRKIKELEAQIAQKESSLNVSLDSIEVTEKACNNLASHSAKIDAVFQLACSPLAASSPRTPIPIGLKLSETAKYGNGLLKKLDKDIFEFDVMCVKDAVEVRLIDRKHDIFLQLNHDDFHDRVFKLEEAYCADYADRQQLATAVLYRPDDHWCSLDARQSDVVTLAWKNALTQTASAKKTTVDRLRKSVTAFSLSPDRRSTLSSLLAKGDSLDGSVSPMLCQYIHSIKALDQNMDKLDDVSLLLVQIEATIKELQSLHRTQWGQAQIVTINKCVMSLTVQLQKVQMEIGGSRGRVYEDTCWPLQHDAHLEYMQTKAEEKRQQFDRLWRNVLELKGCWLTCVGDGNMDKATDALQQMAALLPDVAKLWPVTVFYAMKMVDLRDRDIPLWLHRSCLTGLESTWCDAIGNFQLQLDSHQLKGPIFTTVSGYASMCKSIMDVVSEYMASADSMQQCAVIWAVIVDIVNPLTLGLIQMAGGFSGDAVDKTRLHGLVLQLRSDADAIGQQINSLNCPDRHMIILGDDSDLSEVSIPDTNTHAWLDAKLAAFQEYLEKL